MRPVFFEVRTYPRPTGTSMRTGTTAGWPSSVCQSSRASPFKSARMSASAYCVVPEANAYLAKMGDRTICGASGPASSTAFVPVASIGASIVSAIGTSTVGMVVVPPFPGSPPTSV